MTTAPIDLPDLDALDEQDDAPPTTKLRLVDTTTTPDLAALATYDPADLAALATEFAAHATAVDEAVDALTPTEIAAKVTAALAGEGLVVIVDELAAGPHETEPVFRTLCRQYGTPELYRHGIPGLLVLDEAPTSQETVQ